MKTINIFLSMLLLAAGSQVLCSDNSSSSSFLPGNFEYWSDAEKKEFLSLDDDIDKMAQYVACVTARLTQKPQQNSSSSSHLPYATGFTKNEERFAAMYGDLSMGSYVPTPEEVRAKMQEQRESYQSIKSQSERSEFEKDLKETTATAKMLNHYKYQRTSNAESLQKSSTFAKHYLQAKKAAASAQAHAIRPTILKTPHNETLQREVQKKPAKQPKK